MPELLTPQRGRVETVVTIQYLRAVAAALIVFQHAMGMPAFVYYTAHFGTVGVDLFFMISGFIMWTTTAAPDPRPRRVLARARHSHRAALLDVHDGLRDGSVGHAGELLQAEARPGTS